MVQVDSGKREITTEPSRKSNILLRYTFHGSLSFIYSYELVLFSKDVNVRIASPSSSVFFFVFFGLHALHIFVSLAVVAVYPKPSESQTHCVW